MRAKIRFFQLSVDDGYIFGLDGNGRVWRTNVNPAKQSNWVMIGSPDVPDEDLKPRCADEYDHQECRAI